MHDRAPRHFSPLPPLVLLSSQGIRAPSTSFVRYGGRGAYFGEAEPAAPALGSSAAAPRSSAHFGAGRGRWARPLGGAGLAWLPAGPFRTVPRGSAARPPPRLPPLARALCKMAAAAERGADLPAEPPRGARPPPPLSPEEVARRLASTRRELSNRRKILLRNLPAESSSQVRPPPPLSRRGELPPAPRAGRGRRGTSQGCGAGPGAEGEPLPRAGGREVRGCPRSPSFPGVFGSCSFPFLPAASPLGLLLPAPPWAGGFVTAVLPGAAPACPAQSGNRRPHGPGATPGRAGPAVA